MEDNAKIVIRASGNARVFIGHDEAEHDELMRRREEVIYLKQMLAEKEELLKETRKLLNHIIGKA